MTTITPTTDMPVPGDTRYPVDSATRACCGGIGAHTQECPTAALDTTVAVIDAARATLNTLLRGLPAGAPLFAQVDLVAGLTRLRQAAVLLDRAADQIEAAGVIR